ncbi:hypothetical protein IM660_16710 [Ruania alkalisoli]|uniref:ABC transporter permease n=1 Tax=Ruania alkalisoli TaxID=2779775 RepID=A0A7M1STY2_9MICO|nr:hypothetical protein [Ruania alkalisoli]QOR70232.1 hypothetical protein IM660_16710 [Ruania alkalisoli]
MGANHVSQSGQSSRPVVIALALVAVACVVVLALVWPVRAAQPQDVPIGIVGPEPAVAAVEGALAEHGGGAFEPVRLEDRETAVERIEEREVYGAIVLGQQPEVLIASAGASAVATALADLAPMLQAQLQQAVEAQAAEGEVPRVEVTVTDLVPLAETDPRGAGLALMTLPLLIAGMIGGIVIGLKVAGTGRRMMALAVYSVGAGLALPAVLGTWLGIVPGDYWAAVGVFALTIAAIAATLSGLVALLGPAGAGVGAVLFVLVANPISSANMPMEFLPEPWGLVGQWFPPGAAATLVRDVSYFPEAGVGVPVLVLSAWAVAGVVLMVLGGRRAAVAPGAERD